MLKEFKTFLMQGNVLDLAVAVVIGAAFGLIVASFVKDIIMPPIGLLMGHVDFANLMVVLKEGTTPGPYATPDIAQKAGAVTINYGQFLNTVVNFLIVAAAIFMVIKVANRFKKAPVEVAEAPLSDEIVLLTEIRDLLKAKA